MICMGCVTNYEEYELQLEELVQKNFPNGLSKPEVVEAAFELEQIITGSRRF